MISETLVSRFYGLPGDPRYNGTLAFYSMVRLHISRESTLLNLGAGPASHEATKTFKGEVGRVVGADIDPVVLANDELDEAFLIDDGKLPFKDNTFDLAFSDFVLEHVEQPLPFLRELHRVLKPGANYFFRTPNCYHYAALISRVTPHWFHELIANRVRAMPADAHAPWPTYYRLNTRRAVARAARIAGFKTVNLAMVECQPSYLMFHALPFLAGVAYERIVNSSEMLAGLRSNIFGQLVK